MKRPRPATPAIVVLDDAKLAIVRGGDGTATAPRDSVSGNSTGRRQHKPFTLEVE